MEVNFMGAVATSQAFIPLLRSGQQKGRIINVSSVVSGTDSSIHTKVQLRSAGHSCCICRCIDLCLLGQ
jgi:short-subunit dehydrogenase involved in D-alanine esterification of teichoic acids